MQVETTNLLHLYFNSFVTNTATRRNEKQLFSNPYTLTIYLARFRKHIQQNNTVIMQEGGGGCKW